MSSRLFTTAAVALLVVLAGCAGGITTSPATPSDTSTSSDTVTADGVDADTAAGTVQFYISDERNDIDDFESLNVTVTSIGFQRADGEAENETESEERDDEMNETGDESEEDEDDGDEMNETDDAGDEMNETDDESGESEGPDGEDWVTVDIEDTTVDLTELKGANASLLANVSIPNGTYNKVFIEISETEGTLKSGGETDVKLPSERLQLNKQFTIGNNESVSFVYDVTAVKAGQSGQYILKPVVSESGTDVEIEDVDDRRGPPEDRGEDRGDRGDRDAEDRGNQLNVSVDGEVAPNETVTLTVTDNGSAVANATVTVNDEAAGTTADDGTVSVTIPDTEEVEIGIEAGEREAELEYEFEETETAEEAETADDREESDGAEDDRDRGGS